MIHISSLTALAGEVASLLISTDEEIAGIQFHLLYDPTALEFQGYEVAGSPLVSYNLRTGDITFVVSQALALAQPFMRVDFLVHQSAVVTVAQVIAASVEAQDIPLENAEGTITIQGATTMQVTVSWRDPQPKPDRPLIGARVYTGQGTTPLDQFTLVGEVAPGVQALTFPLSPDQGIVAFYVTAVDPVRETDPSEVVTLDTDALLPPNGVTVEITG